VLESNAVIDEIDEDYSVSHEAKIFLHEEEDGSVSLIGKIIDEDGYYEKLRAADEEMAKEI